MKKNLFLLLFILLPTLTIAQDRTISQAFLSSGISVPSDIVGKNDVLGSQFLNEDWTAAIVKTQKDQLFKDISVKYSLLDDQLYFLGDKNVTMKFVAPIKEFSLLGKEGNVKVFKSGFPKIANFDGTSYYQILAEGKISLLKKVTKRIIEEREYNSATTTKRYIDNIKYFLSEKGEMTELKKDKKFINEYFAKDVKVGEYLKANKIDFKNENNLISLIEYINK